MNIQLLSHLCWCSHVAYREWKAAGCPRSSQVVRNRKKSQRNVASHLTKCKACIECMNIQKCNESFASESPRRFRSHPSKSEGSSFHIDGTLVSDPDIVLKKGVDHFSKLSESSTLQILLVPNESHNLPRQWFCFRSTVFAGRDQISSSSFKERQLWWTWSAYSTTFPTQLSSVQKLDLQNL